MIHVVTRPEMVVLADPNTVATTSVSAKVRFAERHQNDVRKLQHTTYKVMNSWKPTEKMRQLFVL